MSGHVNHVGIVVDDLDEIEQRVRSVGFEPHMHANYEPGRRFYFFDDTGLEIEVVSYNSRLHLASRLSYVCISTANRSAA